MKNKTSHPERYYYVSLICLILLFLNFYRTDNWTGDKPFSEFVGRDWQLFAIFLIEEFIVICVMVVFWLLGNKNTKKRNSMIIEQWKNDKYSGIKPGDYDYVWFDFSNTERALILKQGDQFKLYVQEYDEHTGDWRCFNGVSIYDNLNEIKKTLFYEYDFYCEENAELDKHGDEVYIEEIVFPISSIQDVTREEISLFNTQHSVLEVDLLNAHRCWCRKYRVNKPNQRYVCDRTNLDGKRRMVFYGNPCIVVVANKEQEDLWFELIEKMKSVGYYSFDID
ncbi:MAG: hypothetical protein IJF69_03475 [Clostridia bacterium]|nr:hypothetical protein [Clostridia bacterium]